MASENSTAARKLLELFDRYSNVSEMHPLVKTFFQDSKNQEKLATAMEHTNYHITSRSQNLDDHEINVAEKVFVELFDNNYTAAIYLFAEEILGLKFETDNEKAASVLESSIAVRAEIRKDDNQTGSPLALRPKTSTTAAPSDSEGQAVSTPPPAKHEATLARLEGLVESSQEECSQADADSYKERGATKFLRDTIDNLLEYVKNLRGSQPPVVAANFYEDKLPALLALREEADKMAAKGYNGKKRPFERKALQETRAPPALRREDAVVGAPGRSAVSRRVVRGPERREIDRYRPYSRN